MVRHGFTQQLCIKLLEKMFFFVVLWWFLQEKTVLHKFNLGHVLQISLNKYFFNHEVHFKALRNSWQLIFNCTISLNYGNKGIRLHFSMTNRHKGVFWGIKNPMNTFMCCFYSDIIVDPLWTILLVHTYCATCFFSWLIYVLLPHHSGLAFIFLFFPAFF